MYFSDLRISGDAPENKQRLNLSTHAFHVLTHDVSVFHPDESPMTETGAIPSGVVNHIFRCLAETAESSIAGTLRSRQEEYLQTLSAMTPETARDHAISLLLAREEALLKVASSRRLKEKGHAFSLRIDRENLEYLSSPAAQAEARYYQDNIGSYLKAILEEYAELPYLQREHLYCKKHLETIYTALELKKRLKLTLRNSHLATSEAMYMKPYAVLQDSDRKYNYLVGMLSDTNNSDTYQYASIRLTSIIKCTRMEKNGALKSEERKEIERRVKDAGVPYLSSGIHTQIIKVRLTEEGIKMFNSILHLRPMYISKYQQDGSWIYEFDCLPWQAEIYFFKFGEHAVILEPFSLADRFTKKYHNAFLEYQK